MLSTKEFWIVTTASSAPVEQVSKFYRLAHDLIQCYKTFIARVRMRAGIPLFWVLFIIAFNSAAAEEVMHYKLWGSPDGRHGYQVELLRLAMEKTAGEYSAYTLTENNQSMGSIRGRREVAKGVLVNIYASPARLIRDSQDSELITIPVPLLKGLLGYRKLIIRKADSAMFASIGNEEFLKSLKAGHGRGWPDIAVYRENGYQVVDSGRFPDLFLMLDQKRFDYLPLGIMEADQALRTYASTLNTLDTVTAFYLYYPFPVFFHVSASEPLLAERLEKGLQRAVTDGSRDELFNRHFSSQLRELDREDYLLFVLNNSAIEPSLGLSEPLLAPGRTIKNSRGGQ